MNARDSLSFPQTFDGNHPFSGLFLPAPDDLLLKEYALNEHPYMLS